jgi:hypothetical protein
VKEQFMKRETQEVEIQSKGRLRPRGYGRFVPLTVFGILTMDLAEEQILEKLLALNLERAASEKKSTGAPKKRSSRAKTAEEFV